MSRNPLDWQDAAACKGAPLDLFFGPDDETGRARNLRVKQAAKVCITCPVWRDCRAHSTATRQTWGVWGGVDRERTRPAVSEPPVLCGRGLHLMTPDNAKTLAGTSQVRCRECQRDSDRRTGPARRARNAETRNARDRARYAERVKQQEEEMAS